MSSGESQLNRSNRGPASGDAEIAQQGLQQGDLGGSIVDNTRAKTGDLPQGTEEKIRQQAEFLADDVSGMKQADTEIGAGKGAVRRDEREGRR